MAITEHHYSGTYEGHSIELVRGDKSLKLIVDGKEAASLIGSFEGSIGGSFEHGGVRHTIRARSASPSFSTEGTVEVDGNPLPLTATE